MGKPGYTGIKRIIKASGYSIKGLRAAWKYESAFRQEAVLAVILVPLAFWLGTNATQYSLLIGSVFLVVIIELLNSSIEAAIDRIGDEAHKLSGQAKDMGSAAVFISLLLVLIIWGSIAWEQFFS